MLKKKKNIVQLTNATLQGGENIEISRDENSGYFIIDTDTTNEATEKWAILNETLARSLLNASNIAILNARLTLLDNMPNYLMMPVYDDGGAGFSYLQSGTYTDVKSTYYAYNKGIAIFEEVELNVGDSLVGLYSKYNPLVEKEYTSYQIGNGITSETGDFKNLNIINEFRGLPVTRIANKAFKDNLSIISLKTNENMQYIDTQSFYGCANLYKLDLNSNLKSIDCEVFDNTSFYANPDNWVNDVLKHKTFLLVAKSNVTVADIDEDITIMASKCYSTCKLTNINLNAIRINNFSNYGFKYTGGGSYPDTILSIGSRVTHLPSFLFLSGSSGPMQHFGGVKVPKFVLPSSIKSLGSYCFSTNSYASNLQGHTSEDPLVIPSSVEYVEPYACSSCDIYVSVNCNYISDFMFSAGSQLSASGSLLGITIGPNVKSIGNEAFRSQTKLKSINIPNSVTSIGDFAFANTSGQMALTSISFAHSNDDPITLPNAGAGSGMLRVKTARNMTIYSNNQTIQNYAYTADNITATIRS